MKKILFILILFIPSIMFAREFTLNMALVVGTDTTIYLTANNTELVTFDFSTFNADDATLDIGYTDDRVSFVSIDNDDNPFTMSKVTYTKTANGYTRNRIGFKTANWPGTYIAFKITKSSVTTGTLKVIY